MKSLGLIVEQGHPSAPIDREETKAACRAMLADNVIAVLKDGKAIKDVPVKIEGRIY